MRRDQTFQNSHKWACPPRSMITRPVDQPTQIPFLLSVFNYIIVYVCLYKHSCTLVDYQGFYFMKMQLCENQAYNSHKLTNHNIPDIRRPQTPYEAWDNAIQILFYYRNSLQYSVIQRDLTGLQYLIGSPLPPPTRHSNCKRPQNMKNDTQLQASQTNFWWRGSVSQQRNFVNKALSQRSQKEHKLELESLKQSGKK